MIGLLKQIFSPQGTRLLEGVDGAKPELFSSLEFANVQDWHRNSLAAPIRRSLAR